MIELWTEKYRPKTISEYVFTDSSQRNQVEAWIKDKSIPHLLFSGSAGTGKTTLAKILINELEIQEYDTLHINASRDNGVDFIKDRVESFVQTMPFGDFKVVLLDEADYMSQNAQAILRGLMETYAGQSRFILTCNYPHKVIPALHSRTQGFHIDKTDHTEFTARVATILVTEGIEFELDTLDSYVKATYPDLRKCLNLVQPNSQSGQLLPPSATEKSMRDWKLDCVDLFKQGRVREARSLLCQSSSPEAVEEIFTWMYNNLDLWSQDATKQDQAIVIIRNGMAKIPLVADQEINLSATLAELTLML
jgi:replication factor C small subunit